MSETNSLTTTVYRCAWVWIRLGHRCGRCILYSIWFSNFHSWCKAWQRGSQSMTNESIYPRLGTKSVPWLAGFPLTGTTSLIKTGRSPANMARPSFSQQSIERSGRGDQCASGAVASHGSSCLCSYSCLSFPWLCLNTLCVSGQGSLCQCSLTFLLQRSHVTQIRVRCSPHAPRFLDYNVPVWDWRDIYFRCRGQSFKVDAALNVAGLFCRENICCVTHPCKTLSRCSSKFLLWGLGAMVI